MIRSTPSAASAIERGLSPAQEIEADRRDGLEDFLGFARKRSARLEPSDQPLMPVEHAVDVREGLGKKMDVVADILGGGVDLVGYSGRQAADRLHLLGMTNLHFPGASFGHIPQENQQAFARWIGVSRKPCLLGSAVLVELDGDVFPECAVKFGVKRCAAEARIEFP